MVRHIEAEVAYDDDFYPAQEEVKREAFFHAVLISYLVDVLTWLLRDQHCIIYENLKFYQTANPHAYPLDPDIAVIKFGNFPLAKSRRDGTGRPAPQIAFSITSKEGWQKDLEERPAMYARMGVQEYFVYNYHIFPPPEQKISRRLFGWWCDQDNYTLHEMPPESDGRLWSPHLACSLVPDQAYLRLYDSHGRLCLTRAEYETQRVEAEVEAGRAEAQQVEARSTGTFAESLRALGIDPDV